MIYSERSWKMKHFLFLRHVLNRCSFRDNCFWNFVFVYKLFVVIHKLFWIFCGKIDFCIDFLNFHKMNIVAIFIAKRDEQNDTKIIQFEHCFGLLKRKFWFMLSIQCSFYENLKNRFFPQKIQKSLCITTKSL